jgi:hypothetical protein
LGNDSTDGSPVPVEVSGLDDAVQVSAGDDHGCAVRRTGKVACWGKNDNGQLGNYGTTGSLAPVEVSGLGNAVQVSAGSAHTCAVRETGKVVCWGKNDSGQLGDGTTEESLVPTKVKDLTGAVQVSAGDAHSCAVTIKGNVHCWGNNGGGRIGYLSAVRYTSPVLVLHGGASCNVWVKLDLEAGTDKLFTMSYGDPTRASRSDAEATFTFYDGFDGNSLDTGKWDTVNPGAGTAVVSGGNLTIDSDNRWLNQSDDALYVLNRSPLGDDFIAEALVTTWGRDAYNNTFGLRASAAADSGMYVVGLDGDQSHLRTVFRYSDGADALTSGENSGPAFVGDGKVMKYIRTDEVVSVFYDNEFVDDRVPDWGLQHVALTDTTVDGSAENVFDWIRVRRFAPPTPPESGCVYIEYFTQYFYHCFTNRTWASARNRCRSVGMELARIESLNENDLVAKNITSFTWIGGNDRTVEGEWRWAENGVDDGALFWQGQSDGTRVTYANWEAGQPDSSSGDCARMAVGGDWAARSCTANEFNYLCDGWIQPMLLRLGDTPNGRCDTCYDKSLSLANGTGPALSDYQSFVTLGAYQLTFWANVTKTGDGIRFYDSDGVTPLPFWIQVMYTPWRYRAYSTP